MNENNIRISIVIIGFNSRDSLEKLLFSLSQARGLANIYEIIYVDDGSKDGYIEKFISFSFPFNKKHFKFQKNMGRVFATQKGLEMASGNWVLLLRSNVVVAPNIINAYCSSVENYTAFAFVGKIKYLSQDLRFQNYLNHFNRGLNSFSNADVIHYKYLLFGNCLIKKSVFSDIHLNLNLKYYGGEELDFAYYMNLKYPHKIRYCEGAVVIRKNHPVLKNHLLRLFEFGSKNLQYLHPVLQKEVVKFIFLINKNIVWSFSVNCSYFFVLFVYQLRFVFLDYYMVRILMLCSILRGFYVSK